MSAFLKRWAVPVSAALAVLAGGTAIGLVTAAADSAAPPRSAADLLVDLQSARLDALSGTIVQRSDLGLPVLPGLDGNIATLLTGNHTLRVWYSGPDKARVAVVGTLGETDLITNGRDVWVWSSQDNKALHRTQDLRTEPTTKPPASFDPQQLAKLALTAIDPSTAVTTNTTPDIAGRTATELVLTPRDPATLIGSIRIALDAVEHLPLRVAVYPRNSDAAAIEAAFTQVSFARPDDAQFAFNPPPGATVEEATTGPDANQPGTKGPGTKQPDAQQPDAAKKSMAVVGQGWTSVVAVRLPDSAKDSAQANATIQQLPAVKGAWGSGRLVTSRVLTVLLTDDGRLLIGAVAPERLYAAAADPKAAL
jgi:outer membrane lipoprotein-sorting protein